jgi:hypothetical protein
MANGKVVKEFTGDATKCSELVEAPEVSEDGNSIFFVDVDKPNQLFSIDKDLKTKLVYTLPAKYKVISGFFVNGSEIGVTAYAQLPQFKLEEAPEIGQFGWVVIINGKEFNPVLKGGNLVSFNADYFVIDHGYKCFPMTHLPLSVEIHKRSDGSLSKAIKNARVRAASSSKVKVEIDLKNESLSSGSFIEVNLSNLSESKL